MEVKMKGQAKPDVLHRTKSISVTEGLEEGDDLVLAKGEDVVLKTDDFCSRYETLKELGRGKFGIVQSCRDRLTGEIYAAKFIESSEDSKRETLDEITMMNKLHHKRLIRLQDAYETEKDLVIVMELVTGGELFEKVIEEDHLTEKQVVRYLRQVFFGLQHMHEKNIVHLDLKPENILCVSGYRRGYEELKLIDFGMAKQLMPGDDIRVACGTPEFVAPEVISFQPICLASDMWSLGVIAYVLLSGLSPFMGETDVETLQYVAACEWDFDDSDQIFENVSEEGKDFIRQLLCRDTASRLTINEAFEHPWCKGFEQASETRLNTKNLRKYVARRRWHKTKNAIKAIRRFGSLFHSHPKAVQTKPFSAESPEVKDTSKSELDNKDAVRTNGFATTAENKTTVKLNSTAKEAPKQTDSTSIEKKHTPNKTKNMKTETEPENRGSVQVTKPTCDVNQETQATKSEVNQETEPSKCDVHQDTKGTCDVNQETESTCNIDTKQTKVGFNTNQEINYHGAKETNPDSNSKDDATTGVEILELTMTSEKIADDKQVTSPPQREPETKQHNETSADEQPQYTLNSNQVLVFQNNLMENSAITELNENGESEEVLI